MRGHDSVACIMRVLAIDTALEACSAAVLDTEHAGVVAHESLPMVRGHAEALMPLIARVMERAGARFRRARPHRRHHRARQLHRPARRHRGRARHRARRRQAGDRPDHACRLCRAAHRRRRHAAGGGGDRCAARSRLPAGVRTRRPHPGGAARSRRSREALRVAATGAPRARRHRGGDAGGGLAAPASAPPSLDRCAPRARHRLGGAARRRRGRDRRRRRSRFICARPTRSRRTPRNWRADDGPVHQSVRARRAGAVGSRQAATPRRSPRCMPPRSAAAGASRRSRAC